jgi:hypothetical protein
LFAREGLNLRGRRHQRRSKLRIGCLPCRRHFVWGYAEVRNISKVVEFGCIAEEGAVAALAHICHYAPDGGENCIQRCGAAVLKSGESFRRSLSAAAFGSDEPHRFILSLT